MPPLFGVLLCLLGACYPVPKPMSEDAMIQGWQARRLVISVPAPFSFRHLLTTYTLPPGRYVPSWQDDRGVYFKAPDKIVASEYLSAPSFHDGGLYVRADGSPELEAHVIVRDQAMFVSVPSDFRYALGEQSGEGTAVGRDFHR